MSNVAPTVASRDLFALADELDACLGALVERDWTVAGTGDWSCRATLEHIGDCLLSYAAQIMVQPQSQYVRFEAVALAAASNADLLEFAVAGARILAAVGQVADPAGLAFHPTGHADPEGFVAMGCVELLLHGHDVARALGTDMAPTADVCERLLRRLFAEVALNGFEPWDVLQWATGRRALGARPQRSEWRWSAAPLGTVDDHAQRAGNLGLA